MVPFAGGDNVKLVSLHVQGFGRLRDRRFTFTPGLNVVIGPNEAGKSTLAAAIIASLYGLQRGEKDRWRPWDESEFATTLVYETSDGNRWEVQRAFDRDTKGLRVYDADGSDVAARIGNGKSLVPGEAHLQIPLDVFMQTACVRQRAVGIEGDSAGAVSTALAQALGGGPKEDAAIGAIARLDKALKVHVGTQRAHKNAPLKALREEEARAARAAADARAALDALSVLRERIAATRAERERARETSAEIERRVRALRAAHLRARIAALKDYRDELAALQAARAAYDDVAEFALERIPALDDAYHSWRVAESVADAAARDLADIALREAESRELNARRADAGSLDDTAFNALRAAAAQAEAARLRAAAAGNDAAAARHESDRGRTFGRSLLALALVAIVTTIGVAIAHAWTWTALLGIVATVVSVAAVARARTRSNYRREADAKQRIADAALAEEQIAADTVASVLEPLAISNIDELVRRRERYVELAAREQSAHKAHGRARLTREAADAEAQRFDLLADGLVPDAAATREERRETAHRRAARRHERDGLDASLAMLTMRRGDILHGDDEFAMQAEYDALVASGVEPAAKDAPATLRSLERERAELDARAHEANLRVHTLEGELQNAERNVPDVAELDEILAAIRTRIAHLEAFERALTLARTTIEARKEEAHRAFARRLEQYSADVLGAITGARYGEIRLDPATLAIRVRIPETNAIEDLDRLSAGTQDQVALVVRFATARMFAEGLEIPPLLLDDPFAFWDAARVARCLPILMRGAADTQTILLTASAEFADAAIGAGANGITLDDPLVAV